MARFLLGWELGANRGHLVRVAGIAERLVSQGHEVVIAAQRLSRQVAFPNGVALWQAPLWPRLLANVGALGGPLPNTMGDILYRLGLENPEALPLLAESWEQMFAAVRPDAIAADFAPALLYAARGKIPAISVGLGFDCVPAHLPRFPSLTGQPAAYAEDQVLARMNSGLRERGHAPLDALPQLFAADRTFAGTFAELDPYAEWRQEPAVAPSVADPIGEAGSGTEIFLYADQVLLRLPALWDGLVRSTLPVRVHAQGASATQQAELARLGFNVEPKPLPFALIAERSRIVMSYGSLGFASSALAAGLPSVSIHYDLEKALNGQAITKLQLGGHVAAAAVQPDAFATSLRQLYGNDSFQRRARELAPSFRARLQPRQEELAAEALIELAA